MEEFTSRSQQPSCGRFDPAGYRVEETLRDGSVMCFRAIRPDDKRRLLEHFQSLSPRSVYQRFLGIKRGLTDRDLAGFTELDFKNNVGLAATIASEKERFIGVGRYIRVGEQDAEVAFAVLDEYQGRGIGTLLLKHLAVIAHAAGVKQFRAEVLGSNRQMLEVFANSGFMVRQSHEAGLAHVSLRIDDGQEPHFAGTSDLAER